MGEADRSCWLLSETSGIGETRDPRLQRHLPVLVFDGLLLAGVISGFARRPASYTASVCSCSRSPSSGRSSFGRDYILFPSLTGT